MIQQRLNLILDFIIYEVIFLEGYKPINTEWDRIMRNEENRMYRELYDGYSRNKGAIEGAQADVGELKELYEKLNNREITSETINVIDPIEPTSLSTKYPVGYTVFYVNQDATSGIGQRWADFLEDMKGPFLPLGYRMIVETSRENVGAVQEITVMQTSPATFEVIATFIRTAYAGEWGPLKETSNPNTMDSAYGPNDPYKDYPVGISIFYDTQNSDTGMGWMELVTREGAVLPEGYRFMVKTSKVSYGAIQRIYVIQTHPATYDILYTFVRFGFGGSASPEGEWGPLKEESNSAGLVKISSGTELYDPKKVKKGRYYHYNTGELITQNGVSCSDFIPVNNRCVYEKNVPGHVAFFDKNFDYVYGLNIQNVPAQIEVRDERAKYVSFSFNTNDIDKASWKFISGNPGINTIDGSLIIPKLIDIEPNISIANSKTFLRIPSPYDDESDWEGRYNQVTHPSVVQFENEWNGYKYWLAYTPYPYGRTKRENPCIAASNNGIKWEVPEGVENPLDVAPSGGYNSDTHIFYNEETEELEIWYRPTANGLEYIKRVKSSNGSDWSEPETLITNEADNILQLISPSVIRENGVYRMWFMRDWFIYEMTSKDGYEWSEPKRVITNKGDIIHTWHPNVQKHNGIYYLLNCDKMTNQGYGGDIYYHTSEDGSTWSEGRKIITYTDNEWDLDGYGVYRSTMLFKENSIYIYYGMHSHIRQWTVGLTTGRDIKSLRGIDRHAIDHYI